MKNLKNKPLLVLFTFAVALCGILFFMVFIFTPGGGLFNQPKDDTETLEKNYSEINKIMPGSSTIDEVKKLNGEPTKIEEKNGKIYMYYPTPFEDDGNIVVVKDGLVEYAYEYVFGNYRGVPDDYTNKNGKPNLQLVGGPYDRESWDIFLNKGEMIAVQGDKINAIIYFSPQDQSTFLNGLASVLGLEKPNNSATGDAYEVFYGPEDPYATPALE